MKADGNEATFDAWLKEIAAAPPNAIIFASFVDFDTLFGHRGMSPDTPRRFKPSIAVCPSFGLRSRSTTLRCSPQIMVAIRLRRVKTTRVNSSPYSRLGRASRRGPSGAGRVLPTSRRRPPQGLVLRRCRREKHSYEWEIDAERRMTISNVTPIIAQAHGANDARNPGMAFE